ncbi:CBS domain-containing protein [Sandaracinobacter sp. RS1-74]|uniref:CBS domain-containing protein n=1 Tax=Sandaracinobacteroides sayramensis TaxID=2913411 RepID=UPI001EDBF53A|nr:CBS domain-containing protein [Sandaracinobacteroides sayramensis]MCG2842195.1 CBS domain-containing protein [Sandaracinobacteroides sayramensis]
MEVAGILREKGSAVASVGPDTSVEEIVGELTTRRIGAVLVLDGEEVVGVVSERDVVRGLAGHESQVLKLRAKDIMTSPVITILPGDSVVEAMELMTDRRIRHLPVVESGRLAGLVSIGDLVKARIEEAEREALALKDYIATA